MSGKDIVRWDPKRSKWRRVYRLIDGSRKLSRAWRNTCIDCGSEYWSALHKKFCWKCSRERYRKLSVLSTKAMGEVARAINEGNLRKLDDTIPCVDCGKPAKVYDHRSYLRPLDVDPVCRSCNSLRGPAIEHEALVTKLPRKFRRHTAEQLAEAQKSIDIAVSELGAVQR